MIFSHSCLLRQFSQCTVTSFAIVMQLMISKNSSFFPSPNIHQAHKFKTRSYNQWQDLSNSRHHRNTQDSPDAASAQFHQFFRFSCPFTQFQITLIHVFNFETNRKGLNAWGSSPLNWCSGQREFLWQDKPIVMVGQLWKCTWNKEGEIPGMDVNLFGEVFFPKV